MREAVPSEGSDHDRQTSHTGAFENPGSQPRVQWTDATALPKERHAVAHWTDATTLPKGTLDKSDEGTKNGNISAICGGATEATLASLREKIEKNYPSEPSTLFGEVADVFEEIASIPRTGVSTAVEWTARAFGAPEPIPSLTGELASLWIRSLEPWNSAARTYRVFDIAAYTGDLAQCKSVRDLVQHAFQKEFQEKLELVVQTEKMEQVTQSEPESVLISKNTLLISVDSGLLVLVHKSEMPCKCRGASTTHCFRATECLHRG